MCLEMGKPCWHYPSGGSVSCSLIIVYAWFYSATGQTADITVTCPQGMKVNRVNTVTAKMLTKSLRKCAPDPVTKLMFVLTLPNSSRTVICELSYPGCDTTQYYGGCKCADMTTETITYQLNFYFDGITQTGATLDLEPTPCAASSGSFPLSRIACTDLKVSALIKQDPDIVMLAVGSILLAGIAAVFCAGVIAYLKRRK